MLILEQCSDAMQLCYNMRFVWKVLNFIIKIVQWSIPVVLIVIGTVDMFKAMTMADDEKAVVAARNGFFKRIVYGVVIFLVPFLVSTILSFVENSLLNGSEDGYGGAMAWLACWEHIGDGDETFFKSQDCRDIYKKYTYNCKCIFQKDSNGNAVDEKSVFLTVDSSEQCEKNCASTREGTSDYKFDNRVAEDYENYLESKKSRAEQSGTEEESSQLPEDRQYCYEYYSCINGTTLNKNDNKCTKDYEVTDTFIESHTEDCSNCFDDSDSLEYFKDLYRMDGMIEPGPYNPIDKFKAVCTKELGYNPIDVDFIENGTKFIFTCIYDTNTNLVRSNTKPYYTNDGKYKVYQCKKELTCEEAITSYGGCNSGDEKTIK